MNWVVRTFRSSIGSKILMSITGILLLLFVIAHMSGNLLVFQGREAMNEYAHWLHDHPKLLWTARLGLIVVFLLHIVTGVRLKLENRAARPLPYVRTHTLEASLASRTMVWTGLLVLAYVIYHLLHFTLGVVQPDAAAARTPSGERDVYTMVVTGFSVPAVALSYLVAVALLGFHLWHGIASFFQTMGWNHPRWTPCFRFLGKALALVIFLGFAAVPAAVLTGLLQAPAGGR